MFETRYGFLFGSAAAEFPCRDGLAESVARLRATVSSSEFFLLRQAAVGIVEVDRVYLRRGGPSTNKAYRLRFHGAFHQGEQVSLLGHFVVDGRGEVERFVGGCIWESFLLFCLTGAVIHLLESLSHLPFVPLLIVGVIGGNLWRCKADQRAVQKDVDWLSAVIKDALAD